MNFRKIFSKPDSNDLENLDLTLGIEDFDLDLFDYATLSKALIL